MTQPAAAVVSVGEPESKKRVMRGQAVSALTVQSVFSPHGTWLWVPQGGRVQSKTLRKVDPGPGAGCILAPRGRAALARDLCEPTRAPH